MPSIKTLSSTLPALALAASLLPVPLSAAALPLTPNLSPRDDSAPLPPLEGDHAQLLEFKFQPLLDFDTDSCYNTPAISPSGTIAEGLPPSDSVSQCRQPSLLDRNASNVYVRGRCNRAWCAYIYAYFFPMDWAHGWPFSQWNHRYDWENIVVWAKNGELSHVAASCHGEYNIREAQNVLLAQSPAEFPMPDWDWLPADAATHPKMVFHKDNVRTHCFRFGRESDDVAIENDRGIWIRGGLLGWFGYDVELRGKLAAFDFGSAHLAWHTEEDFTQQLVKSMPQAARDDGFDCAYDEVEGFPGIPKPE